MNKTFKSVSMTMLVNRLVALVLGLLLFAMPRVIGFYGTLWSMTGQEKALILAAFYGCAAAIFPALWNIDRLLQNIRRRQVFTAENVSCIRRLRLSCIAVSILCFVVFWCFSPLLLLSIIMAFLAFIITVLADVMNAAVEIKEENDMTI